MEIIPSIFTSNETQFTQQLQAINSAPIQSVHLDITDGEFVPHPTFTDPVIIKANLQLTCELHLMVIYPLKVLPLWANVPNVKRVLFHYESKTDINSVIDAIHKHGWEAGLVLNPHTNWEVVEPFVTQLDSVMFMGVMPGAQGQALIPEVLAKAKAFKAKYPHLRAEWDGAVTAETLPQIMAVGIDAVCPGHAIFGTGDPVQNVVNLQNLI